MHKHYGRKTPYVLIKEYGSGLNPLRPGLQRIIKAVARGKVSTVLITFKDRLTRFGFPFLEAWFAEHHVNIREIEAPPTATLEQQLVTDLMTLLACFSGKLYKGRALAVTSSDRIARKEARLIADFLTREVEGTETRLIAACLGKS